MRTNPLDDKDRDLLVELLEQVPTVVVTQYKWTGPEGQKFISLCRRLQLHKGVAVSELCKATGVATSALSNAIGYHKLGSGRKRVQRPKV